MRQAAKVTQPLNDVPEHDCWEALVSHFFDLLRLIQNGNFLILISQIQIYFQHFSVVVHTVIMNDLVRHVLQSVEDRLYGARVLLIRWQLDTSLTAIHNHFWLTLFVSLRVDLHHDCWLSIL